MVLNFLGGLVGAGASYAGERAQARAIRDSERSRQNFLREGIERFEGTPIVQDFMPGGANAFRTRQALLGLGGDEGAARDAFNNYLNSTDFRFAMESGQQGISGSRAARGLLGSGRTGVALTEFGQNLGRRYMGNYLGQLQGDAQMGLNAAQTYGNVITGNASQMASGAAQSGAALASNIGNTYGGVAAGIGQMLNSPTAGGLAKRGTALANRFFG
jgi:hypothetical protein